LFLRNFELTIAYLIVATACVLFNVFALPPFQSPDEIAHFFRATHLADGGIVGKRVSETIAGDKIDTGAFKAAREFDDIRFHPEVKLNIAKYEKAKLIKWTGEREFTEFGNTVMYPPFFYLPASTAIRLGQALDIGVISTLQMARFFNGICCIVISALALSFIGRGAAILFGVLLLPMTMSLYGSVTQDGLAIASAALIVSIFSGYVASQQSMPTFMRCILAMLIGAVISARIAYFPLAGLMILATDRTKTFVAFRVIAITAPFILVPFFFSLFVTYPLRVEFRGLEGVSSKMQFAYVVSDPGAVVLAAINTINLFYLDLAQQIVGVLGWLDARFPLEYYEWAGITLAACVFVELFNPAVGPTRIQIAIIIGLVLSTGCAIFFGLYLIWTKVGASFVDGVQGRYLTIPILFLALIIPRLLSRFPSYSWMQMIISPPVSAVLWVFPQLILSRYY
jgi:uncharacterized membrane protein